MFTGIVQGAHPVTTLQIQDGLLTFGVTVPPKLLDGVEVGASVAVNGVCLTLTRIEGQTLLFDVMQQTLRVTNLYSIQQGDVVNVERSFNAGAEIGGHIVSGHVDGVATVSQIERPPNNFILTVEMPEPWMKYVFPKGFLALNGVSLTVAEVDKARRTITVYLIPETLRRTTFPDRKVGDQINFEVERQTQAMVDTVRDFLGELIEHKSLSVEHLRELQQAPLQLSGSDRPDAA
ncbi:riboflavin synthase subunit alpha [Candidatus Uhrbacteria bacterium]|nr:riboflavin synthase subunit alpha [Candidatus Uhrbacteria bacterium]